MSSFLLAPPKPVRGFVHALRRLAESAVSPLVPADYLDLITPLRSGADLRGRVVAVEAETADAATVRIRPGRSWKGHRAGQYVRIGVDVDGVRQWRAYSLTSLRDAADGLLSITVKALPEGRVSRYVVRHLERGALIQLDQAAGDFVLPPVLPAQTLFVTAGSGITPVIGMLRNHLDELSDVVVVHSVPAPADMIFAAELRGWAAEGRLRLVERHTVTQGLLTPADLAEAVPDWRDRETWACGPTGLLDALEQHWSGADLSGRLHTERFRPVVITEGEGGTLSFSRQGGVVEADGATPILDAGEAAGVLMPSGCRMGICFGCVVPLTQGAVRDLRNGELITATEGDGVRIQTCVSAAAGPCTIDL
jgi:ferredoxin-NADP reductase